MGCSFDCLVFSLRCLDSVPSPRLKLKHFFGAGAYIPEPATGVAVATLSARAPVRIAESFIVTKRTLSLGGSSSYSSQEDMSYN